MVDILENPFWGDGLRKEREKVEREYTDAESTRIVTVYICLVTANSKL